MRIFLALCIVINTLLFASPGNTEIYVILFDITGSMEGKGDGRGIKVFDKAKEAVTFFINEIPDDNYLFVYPFHAGLSDNRFQSIIRSGYGRKKAVDFVNGLKAQGSSTWITESYSMALSETRNYLRLHKVNASKVHVFFFTDGKGNHVTDSNIQKFVEVHKEASIDLPLNTKFVAIGDIFLPEDITKLLEEGIGMYSFQRESFSNINSFVTIGNIDTSGGNVKIPYKIVGDEQINGQQIKYKMTIDQIEENIKPEFSKEELRQIHNQLADCNSFNPDELGKLDQFLNGKEELRKDDIFRYETKIKDCNNVSAKDKEKLSKLLRDDYLFTSEQVNKLNMDSVIFSGQGTEISNNRAADTISINSAKVNEIMDSLFNSALDTNKIKAFLENKELAGKVFLTGEAAGSGKEELVMFPDNKFPFAVPLSAKKNPIKEDEKESGFFDKDMFGIPFYLVFILGGIVLAVGVFILIQYYQSEKLKGRTPAYKETDIKDYVQGKPEKLEVYPLINKILQEVAPRLEGVQVQTRLKPLSVYAYPQSLKFVLTELLTNAADAINTLMYEEERKISIETFEDAKYGTIRITNSGGIQMAKEGVIFKDRYSTKNNKGYGLISCHKIMSANKGRIRYEGVSKLQRNEMTNINEVVNTATIMTVDFPKKA